MAGVNPKIAIMVSSCARDRNLECGPLDTWMEAWGDQVEHYLLLGKENTYKNNHDWIVDVPDSYESCAGKTWKSAQFAVQNNLDYIFKCDLDTYVCVPKLLKYDLNGRDYVGFRCSEGHAAGGNGYWLSQKACKVLLETPWENGYQDLWAGMALAKHNIFCDHDVAFAGERIPWGNRTVTMHLGISGQKFNPKWMYDCHEACLEHLGVSDGQG